MPKKLTTVCVEIFVPLVLCFNVCNIYLKRRVAEFLSAQLVASNPLMDTLIPSSTYPKQFNINTILFSNQIKETRLGLPSVLR